jgi:NAD(P)-dependent dehydrogenase (short-subunit alcohol dehydrogenase family)
MSTHHPIKCKVAIITGAARGIGYGIATCLARQGTSVVIADVNAKAARASAKQLAAETGVKTLGVGCDITKRSQVAAVVRQVVKRFGQIDILVNNAGICPFVDIMEMSEAMFKQTMDVNLNGAFHCTQLVAAEMIKRGQGGRIVFITSLAVNVTSAQQGDYAASKAGLHMLMKSFAIALGPKGITCNGVAPRHDPHRPHPLPLGKARACRVHQDPRAGRPHRHARRHRQRSRPPLLATGGLH